MEAIPHADDLPSFLAILPRHVSSAVEKDTNGLYEVVLDLGRRPEARYLDKRSLYLSEEIVTDKDLEYAVERVGEFSGDNRAGIERTLHRISAIRNRANYRFDLPSGACRHRYHQYHQGFGGIR